MMPGLRSTRYVLRLEGLAVLAGAAVGFASAGWSWWWFFGLLLVPDVAMLGYLVGEPTGRWAYNMAHTYTIPLALGAVGWAFSLPLLMAAAWIWAAHIGLDRMLGYGLKLHGGFQTTHLGPIGRSGPHRAQKQTA